MVQLLLLPKLKFTGINHAYCALDLAGLRPGQVQLQQ